MENKMISERIVVIAIAVFSVMLIGSCDSMNVEKANPTKNPEVDKAALKHSNNLTDKKVNGSVVYTDMANGILGRLQKCKFITINFNADIISSNDIVSFPSLRIENSPPQEMNTSCPLVWSGTSFSATFDYSWNLTSGEKIHSIGTISGTMSKTGLNMNSLTAHETIDYPTEEMTYYYDITAKNVPYQFDYEFNEFSPRFGAEGATISQYISSFNIRWDYIDFDGVTQSFSSSSANYKSPDNVPYFYVTFLESN